MKTPMLYLIFIAPCFIIVDKKFSAFMYHADDDTEVANNVKKKLEEQNFRIFLSSEVQGFERKTIIIFIPVYIFFETFVTTLLPYLFSYMIGFSPL